MRSQVNDKLAVAVRAEMGRQQVSISQLAQQLGWTHPYTSRRLRGQQPMTLDDIDAIARALSVSVVHLWTAEDALAFDVDEDVRAERTEDAAGLAPRHNNGAGAA